MTQLKQFVKTHLSFIWEHLPLFLVVILLGCLYQSQGDKFKEFEYAAVRLAGVMLASFVIIHFIFKSTVREFILGGGFKTEWDASTHKLEFTLGIIAFVLWVATQCVIHA